jgi:D-alanine-D-alanine ligase
MVTEVSHVIILYGGEEEADISIISATYIHRHLESIKNIKPQIQVELINLNDYANIVGFSNFLVSKYNPSNTFIIPCVHGHPGESGLLPFLLDQLNFRYLGCNFHGSNKCFNKITTKLWCKEFEIPVTPYIVVNESNYIHHKHKILQFFNKCNKHVFVKAPNQGSSIGCFSANSKESLMQSIEKSFRFNKHVLIEEKIKGREIEVAAFTYQGNLVLSRPGEIFTNGNFYDFNKKYNKNSDIKTMTNTKLKNSTREQLLHFSKIAFEQFELEDLSRIDFFVNEEENLIYLNEINTFPGMTPVSMFPKMMEDSGVSFKDYIYDKLKLGVNNEKN